MLTVSRGSLALGVILAVAPSVVLAARAEAALPAAAHVDASSMRTAVTVGPIDCWVSTRT